MSADNKAIVRRLYEEVWNKRKLEVINEIISPSHALQASNIFGSSIGPEAYKRNVLLFFAGYPDLHWTIEDTIAEKDKVVACWTISGTHKGDYLGVPATNKKVSVEGITIHQITNGKIMDSYVSWDIWGMMQQLGVVPVLGQTKSFTAR
ncbi:MAG TPA: ester cyclase [Candidatus Acidoferrales bacterium]|nr:ester cyclase [Candidatus Acidoferrales bacterium]